MTFFRLFFYANNTVWNLMKSMGLEPSLDLLNFDQFGSPSGCKIFSGFSNLLIVILSWQGCVLFECSSLLLFCQPSCFVKNRQTKFF